MTAPAFVAVADVRNYLTLQSDSTSRYSDATINSNIRAASAFLERATGRYFANRAGITLTLSSNGEALVGIPGGARAITSVTRAGTPLTVDETFWLVPDAQQSGIYAAIRFGPFGVRQDGPSWLHYSEWFDRNLDSPYYPGNWAGGGGIPNDLVLVVDAGYTDPVDSVPELGIATKELAAWFTKRPDAVLAGATFTPDGNAIALDELPAFVQNFIAQWRIGSPLAVSV